MLLDIYFRQLLHFIAEIEDKKTSFQQDNALIHTAAKYKRWYQDFGMELISWPVSSLHPLTIEKLRGILARKIYDQENPLTEDIVELKKRKR